MEHLLVSHAAYKEQDQAAAKQCIGQLKGRRSSSEERISFVRGTSLKHT